MLTEEKKKEVKQVVAASLDKAEAKWRGGGHLIVEAKKSLEEPSMESRDQPSLIPGHPFVQDENIVIDEFIALVVDIRGSSQHLLCAISSKTADVTGIQRVYYENAALLGAVEKVINYENGAVTEYLGDGVLSLFQVDENNKKATIYAAHRAAKNCIFDVREIVNNELAKRYRLPALDIGVGIGLSKCIVTLIGENEKKHPKTIGENIYRATKLSNGTNQIIVDYNMQTAWPSSDAGTLKFEQKTVKGVNGYLLC